MKKIIHISLLILSILVIVTGYGITQYRTVERFTFGLLTKSLSFSLHGKIAIAFILLLTVHIVIVLRRK